MTNAWGDLTEEGDAGVFGDNPWSNPETGEPNAAEIADKAEQLLQQGRAELNQAVDTVIEKAPEKVQQAQDTLSEGAGAVGGFLGELTKDVAAWPGWDKIGEGYKFKAEYEAETGAQLVKFFEKYGDEVVGIATDLALLYAVWVIPIVPPQYKVGATFATLERAFTAAAFSTPVAIKFVAEYAKGAGVPISEEFIKGALEKTEGLQNLAPRLLLRKYVYEASKATPGVVDKALDNIQTNQQHIQDTAWGLVPNQNMGGKVDMRAKFYNNGGIACGPKVKRSGIYKH